MNFIILFFVVRVIHGENLGQTLETATNLFTGSIYKQFSKFNRLNNFVMSPFSAEVVLALAQFGAEGQTKEELRTTLHLPDDEEETAAAFKSFFSKIESDEFNHFRAANKLYIKEGFTVKDEFRKVAVDVFGADLENINFVPQVVEAAETINKWVEEQTENKIQNLVDFRKFTRGTVAILINALYFRGFWKLHFERNLTRKRFFYQKDKNETVDMMYSRQVRMRFRYAKNEELDAKFLELLFRGGNVSMVVALPNDNNGIDRLESHIDEVFQPQNFSKEHVDILLPKFKITTRIDFTDHLQKMGVTKAFEGAEADFSRISDQNLFINEVVQKTFIDVNESGVTAAAATAISVATFSEIMSEVEFKEFHVDHPFIFFIKVHDLVVFAGRVMTPSC